MVEVWWSVGLWWWLGWTSDLPTSLLFSWPVPVSRRKLYLPRLHMRRPPKLPWWLRWGCCSLQYDSYIKSWIWTLNNSIKWKLNRKNYFTFTRFKFLTMILLGLYFFLFLFFSFFLSAENKSLFSERRFNVKPVSCPHRRSPLCWKPVPV